MRRIRRARVRCSVIPPAPDRVGVAKSPSDSILDSAVKKLLRRKRQTMGELTEILSKCGWQPDLPESTTSPIDLPRNDWSGDMFDRYERRALSRRKSAINDFDQARTLLGIEDS